MKSRSQYFIGILLLITLFGILLFAFYRQNQEQELIFRATINHDCAPWDGAAFTVNIPITEQKSLAISIWQSPEILFPTTLSLPNDTLQVGNGLLIPPSGEPQLLIGEVQFQSVREGMPVEGRFSLTSERGESFEGKFTASWENQIVYCG